MGEKIVVGTGPAGLCAAINLSRQGHGIGVLERRDGADDPDWDMVPGEQDPVQLFGIHGAMVSGKIAAMAPSQPERAYKEFRKTIPSWKLSYINRLIIEWTHPCGLRFGSRLSMNSYPYCTISCGTRFRSSRIG